MPKLSTSLRLLLLAAATSFALTSCFGDKKNDPKPKEQIGRCGTTTANGGTN